MEDDTQMNTAAPMGDEQMDSGTEGSMAEEMPVSEGVDMDVPEQMAEEMPMDDASPMDEEPKKGFFARLFGG